MLVILTKTIGYNLSYNDKKYRMVEFYVEFDRNRCRTIVICVAGV